jgi:hypothetical protein
MTAAEYVEKRSKRYMAQVLEDFERDLEPALKAAGLTGEVQSFKGTVRAKIQALARDARDVLELDGLAMNGAALDMRDSAQPTR